MGALLNLRRWMGINRDTSIVDRNPAAADVFMNWKINPDGRLVKRDGYGLYYSARPTLFDYTTALADRLVRNDMVATDDAEIFGFAGKKVLCVGSSYVYYLVGCQNKAGNTVYLKVFRGTKNADSTPTGEITWGGSISLADSLATDWGGAASSVLDFAGDNAGNDQCWINASMVLDSANNTLYIAAILRNDPHALGTNWSRLRIYKISDIASAGWSGTAVVADVTDIESNEDETIDGDDALMNIDIEIDATGILHIVYEYYDQSAGSYFVRYRRTIVAAQTSAAFGTETDINDAGGFIHAPVIVANPNTESGVQYLSIVAMFSAATDRIRRWRFSASAAPVPSSYDANAEQPYTPSLALNSYCQPRAMYDNDNYLHVAYRTDAATVKHCRINAAGTISALATVTDELSNTAYDKSGIGTFNTPVNGFHNWDFVAKDGFVTFYFCGAVTRSTPPFTQTRLVRKWRLNDGDFSDPISVEEIVPTDSDDLLFHSFVTCYRRYEAYGSRRVCYIHTDYDIAPGSGVRDLKFLRNGRTAAEGNFSIEAITEYGMPQVDDQAVQTHVVQCSNNLYYKRNPLMGEWVLLENSMSVLNNQEFFWRRLVETVANGGLAYTAAPDPDDHARFKAFKGELRAGLGNAAGKAGVVYNLIDRYFATNDAVNRYRGMFLDMQPLQAPGSGNLQASGVTYINNSQTLSDIITSAPSVDIINPLIPLKYRRFCGHPAAGEGLRSMVLDDDFVANPNIITKQLNDPLKELVKARAYFFGLSFIYDGLQESQIYFVPSGLVSGYFPAALLGTIATYLTLPAGAIWAGGFKAAQDGIYYLVPFLAVKLQIPHWNEDADTRTNPRITAVRIWMSDVLTSGQDPKTSSYFPVKQVSVSQTKQFKDELWNGEAVWTWDAASQTFRITVPIDLDDILVGQASGEYGAIQGHSWVEFKYEAEKGLQESPCPEAYRHQTFCAGYSVIGNLRWNGKTHPNMIALSTQYSEHGASAVMRDLYQPYRVLPFDIDGLQNLDEQTILAIGRNGQSAKIDIPSLALRSIIGDTEQVVAVDSVTSALGNIIMLSGKKLMWVGSYEPKALSDAILNDSEFDAAAYPGLDGLDTLTDALAFYLSAHRLLVVWLPTEARGFMLDLKREAWSQFAFADAPVCGCEGVDGEMFFVDSASYVYQFPSGTLDYDTEISPVLVSGAVESPDRTVFDLDELLLTYKLPDIGAGDPAIRISLIRDKNDLSAVTHDFAAAATVTRSRQRVAFGTKATRELAVKLDVTAPSAAGAIEVESLVINGQPIEDVDG